MTDPTWAAAHAAAERVADAVAGRAFEPLHDPLIAAAAFGDGWRAALLEHAAWCEQMAAVSACSAAYEHAASQARKRARADTSPQAALSAAEPRTEPGAGDWPAGTPGGSEGLTGGPR